MRAIEDIKQDIKLQERAISYLASVGCDDDAMMSDRRLDYLKTELEFAEKCKECKKKREPLELKWIPIAEELPEKNSNVLVYVQNTRGGFIRGDGYITVATFVPTMIDKYYFNFHGEGLVTHWMGLPKKPNGSKNPPQGSSCTSTVFVLEFCTYLMWTTDGNAFSAA